MIDPELQKAFRDYLTKCDEAWLEYEERHCDAGAAYVYCVKEDHSSKEALVHYILYNFPSWTSEEVKAVLDAFDEWSFDMEPGHRFSTWRNREPDTEKKGCCVWSTSIEEVENQYEVKVIAEALDCEVEQVRELVLAEKELNEFCIGTIYRPETFDTFETYQCTDACWFAVVPYDWFIDKITDIRSCDE